MDWEFKIGEARLEEIHRTARVDRPDNPFLLELFDVIHALTIEDRISAMGDQCAVKISAKEADLCRHWDG